jgi:YbgC/YbaW family acyl-CoA thioester hydrolase
MTNFTEQIYTRAIPIERILSLNPFIVRRRIAFRDCDPAGIVYTPRYLDPIVTSVVELFMGEVGALFAHRAAELEGIGFPAKALDFVFHHPSKVGDLIDIEIFVSNIGNKTFQLTAIAKNLERKVLFDARLTSICILSSEFKAISLPEYLIDKLKPYMREMEGY